VDEMARGSKSVKLDGIEELVELLRVQPALMNAAIGKAIGASLTQIGKKANQLVPIDTGNLRSTQEIKMEAPMKGSISYGGTAAPYALVQHERLDFYHPPKPPGRSKVGKRQGSGPVSPGSGRGPKYLEIPFMEETSKYPQRFIDRVKAHYRFGDS